MVVIVVVEIVLKKSMCMDCSEYFDFNFFTDITLRPYSYVVCVIIFCDKHDCLLMCWLQIASSLNLYGGFIMKGGKIMQDV